MFINQPSVKAFRFLRVVALFATLILSASLGAAPPEDKGPPAHAKANKDTKKMPLTDKETKRVEHKAGRETYAERAERHVFDPDHPVIVIEEVREIVTEVGATGYKPLPPGIRKNLERGKPVPPGIQMTRAPEEVYTRLPVYDGHEWRVAGTDLLLLEAGTQLVADVLPDVFR